MIWTSFYVQSPPSDVRPHPLFEPDADGEGETASFTCHDFSFYSWAKSRNAKLQARSLLATLASELFVLMSH